tara:strand:- start:384 stop:557 length:174 start_codon:yes stop_codon:yes gene_type:complete
MKKLAAQALAFQYKLKIENAESLLNAPNTPLNVLDQALKDITETNAKLKVLESVQST